MNDARERLQRRARQVRANALVRRWEYRQRDHARGVWFRLRRLLADAESAWRLSEQDAARLMREGHRAEPVGLELEPGIVFLVVQPGRLRTLESRRQVPLRLGVELLHSRFVALLGFPGTA